MTSILKDKRKRDINYKLKIWLKNIYQRKKLEKFIKKIFGISILKRMIVICGGRVYSNKKKYLSLIYERKEISIIIKERIFY